MTTEQYVKLVEMLSASTSNNLLVWDRDTNNACFFTKVNGCRLELKIYYNVSVKENMAKLELYNVDGRSFSRYIYSEKIDGTEFSRLNRLNEIVKDKYYKVTESEQRIMKGLGDLMQVPEG